MSSELRYRRQCPVYAAIDQGCTHKPRLVGGVKGRSRIKLLLTGKHRPVGGELQNAAGEGGERNVLSLLGS